MFDVRNRINDCIHLFFSGNIGKDCIIFQERHLIFIPVPFQDIMPEMMELGDMDVDRTIPDLTVVPEKIHVRTDLGPSDIAYRLGKLSFNPFDELDQVADISGNRSVRKIAERERISLPFAVRGIVRIPLFVFARSITWLKTAFIPDFSSSRTVSICLFFFSIFISP